MALIVIFVLGVVNFAFHRAVLDSGHPLLARVPGFARGAGRHAALATEFLVLVGAMLLAANGWPELAWAYAGYSAMNALAAWLIVSRRI